MATLVYTRAQGQQLVNSPDAARQLQEAELLTAGNQYRVLRGEDKPVVLTAVSATRFDSFATLDPDGDAPGGVYDLVEDSFTPVDYAQIAALSSPFYSFDPQDPTKLRGYATLEEALEAVIYGENYIQVQIPYIELTSDTVVADVKLYGKGSCTIIVPEGRTWSFDGYAALENISFINNGTVNGPFNEIRGGRYSGAFDAAGVSRFYDTDLAGAHIAGNGTIYLYGSTTTPASIANTVTVIEQRPGLARSPDGTTWRVGVDDEGTPAFTSL